MAYQKTNWEDFPSTNTPIDASKLNKIEEGIANAVEKTGDTMTGGLLFENKDGYDAIRKIRTINGTDYGVTVGVGANGSARMEYYTGSNTLSSIEARADGNLYNGKTNQNLPEVARIYWGTSLKFKMKQHALVLVSQDDVLFLWLAGNPANLNVKHIFGGGATATYDGSEVTVTYDNRNFTGTALIF